MDYDFRNKHCSGPIYRSPNSAAPSSATHSMYGSPLYPKMAQPGQTAVPHVGGRPSSYHHNVPPQSSSSGMGIRVYIKPDYRITPPPNLSPQLGDVPRSNFQFNFDLERKILAEGEKDPQIWTKLGLEPLPVKALESPSSSVSMGSVTDPVVRKYVASGLNREAVPIAVANYGDDPVKVEEFVKGFTLLREMGFSSGSVAEALLMYDNDKEKALAHFLNVSS